jgi:hypothetical protein
VDPVIADMDESTTHILQHIKWATSKGPLRTDENNWQPELVLDVCTLAPQQDNACGLIVLQYHLILGTMLDKRPDLLHGPQDALIDYIVTEVIPTLRTVNRDTTANYYRKLRGGVESGSWQASAAVHSLWPDNGSPPDKRVKMERKRPQRGMKVTAASQQTIRGFLGKRSIWDQSAPVMHNQVGRAPRSEPEDVQQDREITGEAPVDQIMDTAERTWAEESTAAPEVINLDTRTYNSIEQLQAWFTQETEKEMQEATSDRNRDLRRSSLLWHLYQRKAAEARTVRPWKGRLFALGQPLGESHARDPSTETHGECTHQEQWTMRKMEELSQYQRDRESQ